MEDAGLREACDRIAAGQSPVIRGLAGSSGHLFAGLLARRLGRPVLLGVAHLDEAEDAAEDLRVLNRRLGAIPVIRFPALEQLPGESGVSLELLSERLAAVERLGRERQAGGGVVGNEAGSGRRSGPAPKQGGQQVAPQVIVASMAALMQAVPKPDDLHTFQLRLRSGCEVQPGFLLDWLDRVGYTRTDAIEQPGDFATRGGIIDVFIPAASLPIDRSAESVPPAEAAKRGKRSAGERDSGRTKGGEPANDKTDGGLEARVSPDEDAQVVPVPVRLDFFGDELESIRIIDTETMGSGRKLAEVRMIGASDKMLQAEAKTVNLIDLLSDHAVCLLIEPLEMAEQGRGYYERLVDPRGIYPPSAVFQKLTSRPNIQMSSMVIGTNTEPLTLPIRPPEPFEQDGKKAVAQLVERAKDHQVVVLCGRAAEQTRLAELLEEIGSKSPSGLTIEEGELHRGVVWGDLMIVPHAEIFHRYQNRRRIRRVGSGGISTADQPMDVFFDLEPGDAVVHIDHGVARFKGLKTIRRKGSTEEFLTLEFHGGALLHVPVSNIEQVQKYVGGMHGRPPLSVLGGRRWSKQKEEAAHAARDLAKELLQIQAARSAMPGIRYPADTHWQREFESAFPFDETEDQLATLAEIKKDMSSDRPMDRLICGDVGFGKTELAIRAAFKAAESGRQVAVLVPTTVLAEQHERTFRERMADYPFEIASVSRFKTAGEQARILAEVAAGRVDVIIGTHRLLSKDVNFADLGLVIIDEEQRFGVEHKNRLLQLRLTADVLTLSATPIPRTLHMSMLRLRDISSLAVAPVDRRAVVTEVMAFNPDHIRQAIRRELARDGQVFFVHNRIHNILSIADQLQALVPEAKIVVGHGQMPAGELESVMIKFMNRDADILVSTTIIESGIDIPTANTMFINEADHFGLADLHQLRGRVGRYRHRAYCYLLLPADRPVTESARKRLKAIEQFAMLGAGFKIAMRDLEIRGAGNLLGKEQSGHIAAVGYQMYCMLLERESKRLRHEEVVEPPSSHLELGISASLDPGWIRSDKFRMDAYRRLSRAATPEAYSQVVTALTEAFGKPSAASQLYLDLIEIRIGAARYNVESLRRVGPDLVFLTTDPRRLEPLFAQAPGRTSLIDQKTIYWRPPPAYLENRDTMLAVLRKLLIRSLNTSQSPGASAMS